MTHHLLENKIFKSKAEYLRRSLVVAVVAIMFQGTSSALTSAWADGCVENPNFCVTWTTDEPDVGPGQHTLRSAVASANAAGGAQTIGFADELFGIVRDSEGTVTSSTVTYQNPVIITLESTLEIRSDLTIKAPTPDRSSQILKIARGLGIDSGSPLIAVNPTVMGVPASVGAASRVTIENVIIDSNANPNSGGEPRSSSGVAIQVNGLVDEATVDTEVLVMTATPDLVVKNSQIVNAVSESGGAAINTPGSVLVESSSLSGNLAITPDGGTASDGGAILSGGTVTVSGSSLNYNSATGNGGAIAANSVVITASESGPTSQILSNTAGGDGGAIAVTASIEVNENFTEIRANVAGGNGGALSAGGTVTVGNEVSITDNHAGQIRNGSGRLASSQGGNGGAISAGETVTVTNTTLSNNTAQGIGFDGPATGSGGAIAGDGAVIVQGSVLNDNWSSGVGGAIFSENVTIGSSRSNYIVSDHVVNSELSRNYATDDGGAIFAYGEVKVVVESLSGEYQTVFSENQSGDLGGAIFTESSILLDNVRLSDNRAVGDGGAVWGQSSISVSNSIVRGNAAGTLGDVGELLQPSANGANGGAIFSGDSVTVINSLFESNTALMGLDFPSSYMGSGGGIRAYGNVFILDGIFLGNFAGGSGGAISAGGEVSVTNSVLEDNHAGQMPGDQGLVGSGFGGNGGAISALETVTVSNAIFQSNVAANSFDGEENGNGGAIYSETAVAVSNGSTFAANYANGSGGAIYAIGNISVAESIFGSITQANPDFNPVVSIIENPAYDPRPYIVNPGYNPRVTIANPNYNVNVPSTITNPTYGTEILGEVPNPDCDQNLGLMVIYDGQCFFMETHREGDGEPLRYPQFVSEIVLDSREAIPNPFYDNRAFLVGLLNPDAPLDWRSEIWNPDFNSNEFIQICADPMIACDSRQYLEIGNRSYLRGGAIFINGSINVSDSLFSSNQSFSSGGAIYITSLLPDSEPGARSNSSISGSFFDENQSIDNRGGAIYAINQNLQISDSTFESNSAGGAGGAIRARDGSLEIQNSRFNSNVAGGDGGAIDTTGAELSVIDSMFTSNSADYEGGAIFAKSILLARSAFESNTSISSDGGAIYLEGNGQSVILNSVFEENQALNGFGGAIYGPSWMLFNDFIGNNADTATAIALTGKLGTNLVGNLLQGPDNSEANLCNLPFWNSPDNLASDGSCFFGALDYNGNGFSPSVVSEQATLNRALHGVDPEPYTRQPNGFLPFFTNIENSGYIQDALNFSYLGYVNDTNNYLIPQGELLDLEVARSYLDTFYPQTDHNPDFSYCPDLNNRFNECWDAINQTIRNLRMTFSDSSQDLQNIENIAELTVEAGGFLLENFALNYGQIPRSDSQLWSVGAFQEFLPQAPEQETPSNNEIIESVQRPTEHPRSFHVETEEERESIKIAKLRVAEEKAAAVAAKIAARNARSINRQLKIATIYQKLAATNARGVELKKKIAWINLMRNFYDN